MEFSAVKCSKIADFKPNQPGWVNLPQTLSTPLPLYLKQPATPYWFEYLPEKRAVYCQFNSVRNDDKEPLAAFADRLFKFVAANDVDKLIIDMRWNNGGNTGLLPPLIHGLIKSEKINRRGHLFVIIGRTFSAAQNASTYIERDTNAIFVGEPTGSSPNFVGEEDTFTLPYSKLIGTYRTSTGRAPTRRTSAPGSPSGSTSHPPSMPTVRTRTQPSKRFWATTSRARGTLGSVCLKDYLNSNIFYLTRFPECRFPTLHDCS